MPGSLDYYAQHGAISDPGAHAAHLAELPDDVPGLCRAIQGLVLHRGWAPAYGVELPPERMGDAQARTLSAILDRVFELDDAPLGRQREPLRRFMGTCRDFSLMLCAALRQRGVPARARCGFGSYFMPGRFEDHWVVEHWDAAQGRWVWTDPQLDALQCKVVKADFDPLELPPERFWTAGRAWQACRAGTADPETFGIFDMWGLWFVRGNVPRDLAALNRVELLPWDDWGMTRRLRNDEWPEAVVALLDRIAAVTADPDASFDALGELYVSQPELRMDGAVFNYQTGREEKVPT